MIDSHEDILRGDGAALARILALVSENAAAPNFSDYKRPTLERRIASRMRACKVEDVSEYLRLLERDPQELEDLWHSWLIRVSAFFRDPAAFAALFERGLAPLIRAKTGHDPLRIWVAGCATGEEAYSIAMGGVELLEREGRTRLAVRIYATDLSPTAVARGRAGSYATNIAQDVGPSHLERFFVKDASGYHVVPALRRMIVFGNHDLLSDPFFRHLDLISCRNLLIYWNREAQQRVLRGFWESLVPVGLLLLGPTETLGSCASLFRVVDKSWRLFERR